MDYTIKKSNHSNNFYWIHEHFADGDKSADTLGPVHFNDLLNLRKQIDKIVDAKAAAAKVTAEIDLAAAELKVAASYFDCRDYEGCDSCPTTNEQCFDAIKTPEPEDTPEERDCERCSIMDGAGICIIGGC